MKLKVGNAGQRDSVFFQDNLSLTNAIANEEIETSIKSPVTNFLDFIIALEEISFHHDLEIECSGIVTAIESHVTGIRS